MLPFLLSVLVALPQAGETGKGRLPIQVPEGWTGQRREVAFVLTTKGLPAGKL